MKTFAVLSLPFVSLFFSFSALACPNLTGRYECTVNYGAGETKEIVTYSQEQKDKITIYSVKFDDEFETQKYIADGKKRISAVDKTEENGHLRIEWSVCKGNTLVQSEFVVWPSQAQEGDTLYVATTKVSLNKKGDLTYTFVDGNEVEVETCRRLK